MKTAVFILAIASSLALSACGSDPEGARPANEAAEFSARINGGNSGNSTQQASANPSVASPLPDAAEGAYAPGTATDPQSVTCDANRMGPFIGRLADATTRTDIESTATPGREIRFMRPGDVFITPNANSPRLNMMLDNQDIIRDARCG